MSGRSRGRSNAHLARSGSPPFPVPHSLFDLPPKLAFIFQLALVAQAMREPLAESDTGHKDAHKGNMQLRGRSDRHRLEYVLHQQWGHGRGGMAALRDCAVSELDIGPAE